MKIRTYTFIEFLIWFIIIATVIFAIRFYRYENFKKLPSYQILLPDIDGMIIGSPVKYMGVKVGYIKDIKYLKDNIYVRFIITDKDLKLPKGVIATVEFYGMGGSKSLELYPPDKNENSERLIVVEPPTRLHDAMGLLGLMFDKINSISIRCTRFADGLGVIDEQQEIKMDPENIGQGLKFTDKFLDSMSQNRIMFRKKIERFKGNE